MSLIQPILAYITLAIAVGYIVFKFFLPKSILTTKKGNDKSCGDTDCGCH